VLSGTVTVETSQYMAFAQSTGRQERGRRDANFGFAANMSSVRRAAVG